MTIKTMLGNCGFWSADCGVLIFGCGMSAGAVDGAGDFVRQPPRPKAEKAATAAVAVRRRAEAREARLSGVVMVIG